MRQQLKEWIQRATQLGDPPGPQDSSPVKVRGDQLTDPVEWTGRQWAVTGYGVEARDGTYAIERSRLWEDEAEWGWVRQLEEKNWVDMPDFVEALRVARRREGPKK